MGAPLSTGMTETDVDPRFHGMTKRMGVPLSAGMTETDVDQRFHGMTNCGCGSLFAREASFAKAAHLSPVILATAGIHSGFH